MQLNALNVNGAKKQRKAEVPKNVVMRLDRIVNEPDKPAVFHGIDPDTNEPIRVRMMFVDEGALANARKGELLDAAKARIENQYLGTGEKHRPRPSEIGNPKSKVHCGQGGLLMFTKVLPAEDGLLKAHWVETLESGPGVACQKVCAHIAVGEIRDRENKERVVSSFVHADIIKPEAATILTNENAEEFLLGAFANRDEEALRKPFVLMRLVGKDGSVITDLPEMRVNPLIVEEKIRDHDLGIDKAVYRIAPADDTLKHIMSPDNVERDALILRSVVFGLSEEPGYPDFGKVESDQLRGDLNNIVDAVRSGAVVAEIIPGERISAGPATKASFLKQAQNEKHPLHQYRGTQFVPTIEDGKETRKQRDNVKFYFDTYVTTKVGAGEYRYFVKANPVELFPTRQSLYTLATANDHKATAEASRERANEATAELVDTSGEQFDPDALSNVDGELAASADAVDLSM
ncbi:hypothetical protein LA345_36980 (plasmid) [Burkholderia vietnamiensis]|uniref:Uncharacterized protein n=1 Tax=Burkholderia vietnamiensis (strain G4 / LMG 22486) TaxID=269482 RepID=A4JVC0_BURVG|nr:hypothetical protein Bcep1808_7346 [Burkholderia vietnamiensis G4]MCB4349409.1 hypothetical protein [Burkholderia vietnamiensis]